MYLLQILLPSVIRNTFYSFYSFPPNLYCKPVPGLLLLPHSTPSHPTHHPFVSKPSPSRFFVLVVSFPVSRTSSSHGPYWKVSPDLKRTVSFLGVLPVTPTSTYTVSYVELVPLLKPKVRFTLPIATSIGGTGNDGDTLRGLATETKFTKYPHPHTVLSKLFKLFIKNSGDGTHGPWQDSGQDPEPLYGHLFCTFKGWDHPEYKGSCPSA